MAVGRIRVETPGDIKALKKSLKDSGGDDKWFFSLKADSEITVRFLAEPWEFTSFLQHFMEDRPGDQKSFPCNSGDCEGCDEGNSAYKVWVAPVLDVENNRVRAMRMPKGIVDSLTKKAERKNTIMDRDYIIMREGSGKDGTKYDLDDMPVKRRNLDGYELPDIEGMLESQLQDAMGVSLADEEPPPRRPTKKPNKAASKAVAKKVARRPRGPVDEDDEEPPWSPKPARPAKAVRRPIKKAAPAKKGLRR